jgi:hypothetical protein
MHRILCSTGAVIGRPNTQYEKGQGFFVSVLFVANKQFCFLIFLQKPLDKSFYMV